MTSRKQVVHSALTDPDGLAPCCGQDPRTVGELTLDPENVTCPGDPATDVKNEEKAGA